MSTPQRDLLGAHTSIAGGISLCIDRALDATCGVAQIFVKSNRQWFAPDLPPKEIKAFLDHPRRSELRAIFAHNGYLINPGAPEGPVRDNSIRAMTAELLRANSLELPFIVMHPGAHLGAGIEEGIRRIVLAVDEILAAAPQAKTKLALETTAGQGTTIGHEFAHIGAILKAVREPERFCVCVDTAHLLAAGYDIRNADGYKKTFDEFEREIGLNRIAAFHLNDSKAPLGSKKDRHENIGQGYVGDEAFRLLLNDKRFAHIPKALETPKSEDMHEDAENLSRLRALLN